MYINHRHIPSLCVLAEEGEDVTHAVLAAGRDFGLDTRYLVSDTASTAAFSIVLQDYHYLISIVYVLFDYHYLHDLPSAADDVQVVAGCHFLDGGNLRTSPLPQSLHGVHGLDGLEGVEGPKSLGPGAGLGAEDEAGEQGKCEGDLHHDDSVFVRGL